MNKEQIYKKIIKECNNLFEGINNPITNMANASAILFNNLDNINWAGFYLYMNNELELGPFQGKPACMTIPLNKGVCGFTATNKKTTIVQNVHEFPSHIACDSNSLSEIVVPIIINNELYGLLDIDSPILARFDETDKKYLESIVDILKPHLKKINY